jgi:hypothetical protein
VKVGIQGAATPPATGFVRMLEMLGMATATGVGRGLRPRRWRTS